MNIEVAHQNYQNNLLKIYLHLFKYFNKKTILNSCIDHSVAHVKKCSHTSCMLCLTSIYTHLRVIWIVLYCKMSPSHHVQLCSIANNTLVHEDLWKYKLNMKKSKTMNAWCTGKWYRTMQKSLVLLLSERKPLKS